MDDEPFEIIEEEEINAISEEFESGGLAAAAARIQSRLDELDSVELNIAVTGESGSGKSTFVNSIRGLCDEDENAAKTGVTETTTEPTMYSYPKYPNVRLWDLPGIGTMNFKADEYLEQVNFAQYDFFIIIASDRFKQNHLMLAQEIEKMGKHFYFVRSKIDADLHASKIRRKSTFNEKKILMEIRQDCTECLQPLEKKCPQIFLISGFDLCLYDFPLLEETLERELPEHKRFVFLQALPNISLKICQKKKKDLHSKIWKLATLSCAVAAIPIPGLSVVCDVTILVSELNKYYFTFSLDDKSLNSLAVRVDKPVEDLKSVIQSPLAKEISSDVVIKLLTKAAGGSLMFFEYLVSTIPIIGSLAAGGISFATTYYMLHNCLEELARDAKRVLEKAFESEL
ncbi:interferon-inducible GTPase 5-like [Erpetoichthys calabaricus]|uniref:interferon-inducible GTPase 5-like n=1 Tax=Erpetoichthys calabaricus TaxID=27687 RepID=UPI00223498DE|nr:interferon-inducible GTPase 5-like [Erpetoichthys calabaricus]